MDRRAADWEARSVRRADGATDPRPPTEEGRLLQRLASESRRPAANELASKGMGRSETPLETRGTILLRPPPPPPPPPPPRIASWFQIFGFEIESGF